MCVQRPLGGLKKLSEGCSLGPVQGLDDTGSASIQATMILMLKAAAAHPWQSMMHINTIEGGDDVIKLEPRCSWKFPCIRK